MHLILLLFVSVHGQGILFSVMMDLALIRMKTFYRKPFVSRPINIAGSGTANSKKNNVSPVVLQFILL